ncbi:MAG: DNA-directed RNA polymerase subunit omega [Acidilobaceae archaeon]|nr:DNA-directed RNA polymerase subunit omega [Acidilobaceae archaeon]
MEGYSAYPRLSEDVPIGPPRLTRFEKARIISIRALQLGRGAPPLLPSGRAERPSRCIDWVRLEELLRDAETAEERPLPYLEDFCSQDPVLIAKAEVEFGLLPISIVRYTSSGQRVSIPLSKLLEASRKVGLRRRSSKGVKVEQPRAVQGDSS